MNTNVPEVARGTRSYLISNETIVEQLAVCSRRYLKKWINLEKV